jgi:hypothetical protein
LKIHTFVFVADICFLIKKTSNIVSCACRLVKSNLKKTEFLGKCLLSLNAHFYLLNRLKLGSCFFSRPESFALLVRKLTKQRRKGVGRKQRQQGNGKAR